jgi:hypothetical protein
MRIFNNNMPTIKANAYDIVVFEIALEMGVNGVQWDHECHERPNINMFLPENLPLHHRGMTNSM